MRVQSSHFTNRITKSRGVTIVELLVVMTIAGIMLGVLLPAVQRSRETARRTGCMSNLRQVGIAVSNYVDVYQKYPHGNLRELRPYLIEQDNSKSQQLSHSILACPSDSVAATADGNQSYYFNDGISLSYPGDGFLGGRHQSSDYRSPRDISDGLSNTAAASERLSMPNQRLLIDLDVVNAPELMQRRFFHKTDVRHVETAQCADECALRAGKVPPYVPSTVYYNHILPPNHSNCLNGPFAVTNLEPGVVPAKSEHPGVVNVLMGDGALRFVANSIDRTVWWAIGTRAGGESSGF